MHFHLCSKMRTDRSLRPDHPVLQASKPRTCFSLDSNRHRIRQRPRSEELKLVKSQKLHIKCCADPRGVQQTPSFPEANANTETHSDASSDDDVGKVQGFHDSKTNSSEAPLHVLPCRYFKLYSQLELVVPYLHHTHPSTNAFIHARLGCSIH